MSARRPHENRRALVPIASAALLAAVCAQAHAQAPEPPARSHAALISRPPPRYLHASLELGALLGLGTMWYWIDRERQVADWDYPSIQQRFSTAALRYDNNPFGINFIWHPVNGTAFHMVSRINHLSLAQSAGFGLGASLVWEYGLEFREKISVNDIFVTTGAGVALGEIGHWIYRYLTRPRERAHIWLSARASVGAGYAGGDGAAGELLETRLAIRIAALPGFLAPGRFAHTFADGNVGWLSLSLTGTAGSGVDLFADTMLVGRHWQDISTSGHGHALTVATSVACQYRRETLGMWNDRVGLLHFPGAAVDGHVVRDRVRLSGSLRVHGDFAGLDADQHLDWARAHPGALGKSILRKQGYYYGWGFSARASAQLISPHLELGAAWFHGRYRSHQGLDRTQETLTADQVASDRVTDVEAWLRVIPIRRYYVEVRATQQRRSEQLEELSRDRALTKTFINVGAAL